MLYIARDGAGDITAICNNPTTAENLRALIDDSIEEVPTAGAAEDYVFTIDGKAGSQHIANSEAEVVDFITSTPGIEFKKDSQFYGLPQDETKVEIQNWLDDGHMANELTEELNGALVSEYRLNTIYSKAAPMLEGRDIDTAIKEMYGQDYHETAEKEKPIMNQHMNEEPEMDEANIASMIASMECYMEDVKEAAPAFLADGKNLLDVHGFSFEDVESLAAGDWKTNCQRGHTLPCVQLPRQSSRDLP